jgi:hypothetical protein
MLWHLRAEDDPNPTAVAARKRTAHDAFDAAAAAAFEALPEDVKRARLAAVAVAQGARLTQVASEYPDTSHAYTEGNSADSGVVPYGGGEADWTWVAPSGSDGGGGGAAASISGSTHVWEEADPGPYAAAAATAPSADICTQHAMFEPGALVRRRQPEATEYSVGQLYEAAWRGVRPQGPKQALEAGAGAQLELAAEADPAQEGGPGVLGLLAAYGSDSDADTPQ